MFYDLPPATRNLLIANAAVFLLQWLMPSLAAPFALWPLGSGYFEPWQVVTNAFMHGGFLHLFFNMYALFMFGGRVERLFGGRNYTIYYFVCLLTASVLQLLWLRYVEQDFQTPTVGASGAIFGLLGFAVAYQRARGINIWQSGLGLVLVLNLVFTFGVSGISIGGHLGGLAGGWICGLVLYELTPRMRTHPIVPTLLCGLVGVGCVVASLVVASGLT